MKTIGIICLRAVNSCCRSGPVMPGMATSRIRHLVSPTQSEARNSSADENARAEYPNSLKRSGRDSRTDSSSSTIDTSGHSTLTAADASQSVRLDSPRRTSEQYHNYGRHLDCPSHPWVRTEWKMRTWLLDHRLVLPIYGLCDSR